MGGLLLALLGRTPPRARTLALVLRFALATAGLAGAILLIAADQSTLYHVNVLTVVKKTVIGHQQHGYALTVIGILAIVMALGAALGARPAMLALAALGAVALGIAIIGDSGDIHSSGLIGQLYEDASASAGSGYYLETAGAALTLVGGAGALILSLSLPALRTKPPRPQLRPRPQLPENPYAE